MALKKKADDHKKVDTSTEDQKQKIAEAQAKIEEAKAAGATAGEPAPTPEPEPEVEEPKAETKEVAVKVWLCQLLRRYEYIYRPWSDFCQKSSDFIKRFQLPCIIIVAIYTKLL